MKTYLVLMFLAVAASGCYRWTTPAPPAPSTFGALTGQVRVTLTDGRQFLVYGARVERDSLVGDTTGGVWGDLAPRTAIPRAMVRSLSSRRFSAERTALLAGGLTAGLVASLAVSFASNYHPTFFGP